MNERVPVRLGAIQETLLLPLRGRAVESARRRPRLDDPVARRIVSQIDFDFGRLARTMSEISRLAWIARSLAFDSYIRGFLAANEPATVVNIGCGFDTTFDRVDDGRVSWIDLDLPDVIELRRRFIPDAPRRRSVAASVFDPSWTGCVDRSRPVFLLAAGVLYYFSEAEVRSLLIRFADTFPACPPSRPFRADCAFADALVWPSPTGCTSCPTCTSGWAGSASRPVRRAAPIPRGLPVTRAILPSSTIRAPSTRREVFRAAHSARLVILPGYLRCDSPKSHQRFKYGNSKIGVTITLVSQEKCATLRAWIHPKLSESARSGGLQGDGLQLLSNERGSRLRADGAIRGGDARGGPRTT